VSEREREREREREEREGIEREIDDCKYYQNIVVN
jgi:hypothetical protein